MENQQQNQQLRQLDNSVEIVGTLKSKELEVKISKTSGKKFMFGKLAIVSKFDNRINELQVKVMVMESSKLFKGLETVKNEYKTIDEHGAANADRIRVTGELTLNEYYNQQGNLIQFNEVKGIFFTRLDESNDQPDKAMASIETVVESFTEKLDRDQLPTGEYNVNGFTVAWNNEVVELKKAIIGADLAQAFMNLYQPGSTGRLTFKLNNYVETEEEQPEQTAVAHGFGSQEKVESNTIKNFVNNIEIIGGDMPLFGAKEYTPEEITTAKQVRALKLQAMQSPAPEVPQTNTGFGQGSPSTDLNKQVADQMPINMMGNEMPAF